MANATHEDTAGQVPALAFAALLAGNAALAVGPWFVRVADSGPVAAGFWRLLIALPFLWLLARRESVAGIVLDRRIAILAGGAGLFLALDLGAGHNGMTMTRLGNAVLFTNAGSVLIMGWGLAMLGRWPNAREATAVVAAVAGGAILLGRSLEIDPRHFRGDLLCILAGFFYTFYVLFIQRARARAGNWTLLLVASAAGVPALLALALLLGEPVWPQNWWPLIGFALTSQVIGHGLLVYALRYFPPLIIGMALLTQPAIAAIIGWFAFREAVLPLDALGMALVGGALVLARSSRAGDPERLAKLG